MRLKSLEIQGFKTFPDKTKLDFTEGITAVVGPNGSGKSNISDAIRWVLGEQSVKALRCSKMEDVVFNGTQQRKKAGYAQVTLSMENKDRTLGYDGDEVAITRRYYRSGNSEYLINGAVVRLQDIHELFMDTGLGRDGYSMIGQGKIDAIVASKSEDRREIFEEAAGISRYRYRKAEAERRLEKTEENLVRLRDIFAELEGRIEPLKIQAEKAKAYLAYAEEKRGLEIALWLKTLEKSEQVIREQEDKLEIAQAQYHEAEKSLESILQESETLFTRQTECNIQTDTLRREIAAAEQQSTEQKAQISVLENDIVHNNTNIERMKTDIVSAGENEQALLALIKEKQAVLDEKRAVLETIQERLNVLTEKMAALTTNETNSAQRINELNTLLAEWSAKQADAKILLATSETTLQEMAVRADVLNTDIETQTQQGQTLEKLLADYTKMTNDCVEKQKQITEEINAKIVQQNECLERAEQIKKQRERCHLDSEQLFRKAKMLEDLERNLEGFAHSVKAVMKEAQGGRLKGIHGPVSRVIQVPREYGTAVETALGAAMQNIVTEDENAAKAAIAFLKNSNGGRATFLPLTNIKGRELNENGLEQCAGFIGTASALCTAESRYKEILSSLLGRIVVADNIDHAVAMAKKYAYRFKIVTLDGQVVNAGGSLTGGSLAKGTGLLGRVAEIEQIQVQAKKLASDAEQAEVRVQAELNGANAIQAEIDKMREELTRVREDKIKIDAEINSKGTELGRIKQSVQQLSDEKNASQKRHEELTAKTKDAQQQLEDCAAVIQVNEAEIKLLTGDRDTLLQNRTKLQEELQEERLNLLSQQKDMEAVQSEIHTYTDRRDSDNNKAAQLKTELAETISRNEMLKQQIENLRLTAEAQTQSAEEGRKRLNALTEERTEIERRTTELRTAERDKTAERENLGGELARIEERRNNLQKDYDDILSKLWEEYELTKKEAERIAVRIEDSGKAQRRLAELKQKIRSLGNVNVASIEEYKEVSERYAFLKEQISDIEKSKNELLKLIQDLTKQMREIFVCRFEEINTHFSKTFVELFGGGRAALELTDPENVLTSGIDIKVEPPGKIVSHLELLSGGEKALVAIALYFAIMKVSPAPFCVMDEIEAALDDVNVDRFAAYLRRMNDKTQFICITHRRGTMEEADVLYGVTMQDRGISKLLELRASEIEQKLGMKA